MTPLGWLLVGAAVVAWPARRPDRSPSRGQRDLRAGGVLAVAALCLAVGGVRGVPAALVLSPAAALALPRLRARPGQLRPSAATPLTLDLAAAALRASLPLADALLLAAPAADLPLATALRRTAHLLRLGADASEAWSDVDSSLLVPIAEVAVRSQASGVRLADAFGRLASQLRADRVSAALARAQRAGVHAMGPLAACFLPAFVCLGIVPVIVGIAGSVVGSLS